MRHIRDACTNGLIGFGQIGCAALPRLLQLLRSSGLHRKRLFEARTIPKFFGSIRKPDLGRQDITAEHVVDLRHYDKLPQVLLYRTDRCFGLASTRTRNRTYLKELNWMPTIKLFRRAVDLPSVDY